MLCYACRKELGIAEGGGEPSAIVPPSQCGPGRFLGHLPSALLLRVACRAGVNVCLTRLCRRIEEAREVGIGTGQETVERVGRVDEGLAA